MATNGTSSNGHGGKEILYIGGSDLVRSPNHRAHHFIKFLEGHAGRVDVVSLRPFYAGPYPASPVSKLRQGIRGYSAEPVQVKDTQAGTEFRVHKLPNRMDPLLQDVWAYLHLGELARRHYDVGIFGNPDNAFLAWMLKKRGIVDTLVYDDWDYFAGFDRPLYWRLPMAWRERFSVSIADKVISVGNLLAELRQEQGARETFVVPNGVNYHAFARAQDKKPHPPTLVYTGSIEEWAGLDITLEGFARVRAEIPAARYLIIGPDENDYGRRLRELASRLALGDSVRFLGYRPYEELPEFLAEADIGVALFWPTDQMKYAFHLKVVEYMAAGLAVVGTRVGETERIIFQAGAGRTVDFSAGAFATAVLEMLHNEEAVACYAAKGIEFARLYDWNLVFADLQDIIGLRNGS
jgi:glycosyltransferase involved in cell wall biosynthesis